MSLQLRKKLADECKFLNLLPYFYPMSPAISKFKASQALDKSAFALIKTAEAHFLPIPSDRLYVDLNKGISENSKLTSALKNSVAQVLQIILSDGVAFLDFGTASSFGLIPPESEILDPEL